MNQRIKEAIETAMARIGCPPGDNADADIYRELEQALTLLADQGREGEVVAWMHPSGQRIITADTKARHAYTPEIKREYPIPLYRHPHPTEAIPTTAEAVAEEEEIDHPDMTCGACRGMLRWKHGQYHHHGPMMDRHGVVVAEPWEEAGVVRLDATTAEAMADLEACQQKVKDSGTDLWELDRIIEASQNAPMDSAAMEEVIRAGEAMASGIRTYVKQRGWSMNDMDNVKSAVNQWTATTAKHRTAS